MAPLHSAEAYQQLAFQRRPTFGFVREAALLVAQDAAHPLRRMFEEKVGLTLEQFIDMSYALGAQIIQGSRSISISWFEPFRIAYGQETVDRFVASIARTLPELREFARALPGAQDKVVSEYFEFTALTRYPLLRVNDQLYCWHPLVYFRGMEGFVHSVLSEANPGFIEPFSKLFERHVVAEARSVGAQFFDEQDLRTWLPRDTQVPDGLLAYESCNVIIESKAGLFDESVMTVGHATMFAHKTKALLKAANQAWSASVSLRAAKKAAIVVAEAPVDYLLIVTNKELSAGRGTTLGDMYPDGKFAPPSIEAANKLPLAHIYVVSIEDFERLIGAVRGGDIQLATFLADCAKKDAHPETMTFYLHQHLSKVETQYRSSAFVEAAEEAAMRRLEKILQS